MPDLVEEVIALRRENKLLRAANKRLAGYRDEPFHRAMFLTGLGVGAALVFLALMVVR